MTMTGWVIQITSKSRLSENDSLKKEWNMVRDTAFDWLERMREKFGEGFGADGSEGTQFNARNLADAVSVRKVSDYVVKAALEEFASLLGDSEQRQQLCKYLDAI